jgi:phage terminase large subunit-like protein
MTQAVQEFYRDVGAKVIAHDGDRVQGIHIAAIEGRKDSNGDWRIEKLNKPNPIDAGTATIIAFGRCRLALPPAAPFMSSW